MSRVPGEDCASSSSVRKHGALAFEAPEVSSGRSSCMSDVYSFGCILFCMGSGRQNPLTHGPLDLDQDPLSHGRQDPLSHGRQDPLSHGRQDPFSYGRQNPLSHGPHGLEDSGRGQGQGQGQEQACVGVPDGAGGPTLQPEAGGATLQPGAGGATLQPEAGGSTLQPEAGGATQQPEACGSMLQQEAGGGSTLQPEAGGSMLQPEAGGGSMLQPEAGGSTLQPEAGGSMLQPEAGGATLQWPSTVYPPLRQLGEACLSLDPSKRPSFVELTKVGQEMSEEMCQENCQEKVRKCVRDSVRDSVRNSRRKCQRKCVRNSVRKMCALAHFMHTYHARTWMPPPPLPNPSREGQHYGSRSFFWRVCVGGGYSPLSRLTNSECSSSAPAGPGPDGGSSA